MKFKNIEVSGIAEVIFKADHKTGRWTRQGDQWINYESGVIRTEAEMMHRIRFLNRYRYVIRLRPRMWVYGGTLNVDFT